MLSGWKTSSNMSWVSGSPYSISSGYGTTLSTGDSGTNEAVTNLNKSQLENLLQFRMTGNGPYTVASSAINVQGNGAGANQGQTPFTGEAFFNPGAGQLGTLQKRMFTGPNVFDWDTALIKSTQLREHMALDIRVEALNVFNHPSFTIPDASYSLGVFGLNINSPQFGKITNESGVTPRRLQFNATLRF